VSGGYHNHSTEDSATVSGGRENIASGASSTVGGGSSNEATGSVSTVAGGIGNVASGLAATIPGGSGNRAVGAYSFAVGQRANAQHDGSYVFTDAVDRELSSDKPNEMVVRMSGGYWFWSDAMNSTGVRIVPGANSWSNVSDRNAKENFVEIDKLGILEALRQMPVTRWNLKAQDPGLLHIGPMAQDFYKAFSLGEDEKLINTSDALGVSFAAIQGLCEVLEEKEARIQDLEARLQRLEELVSRDSQ
jgi:hypothetical protein